MPVTYAQSIVIFANNTSSNNTYFTTIFNDLAHPTTAFVGDTNTTVSRIGACENSFNTMAGSSADDAVMRVNFSIGPLLPAGATVNWVLAVAEGNSTGGTALHFEAWNSTSAAWADIVTHAGSTAEVNLTLNMSGATLNGLLIGGSGNQWMNLIFREFSNAGDTINMDCMYIVVDYSTPDVTAPQVNLTAPANTTYGPGNIQVTVYLNEDTGNVTAMLDSTTNYSLANSSGSWNVQIPGPLANGSHNLRIFANDSAGNMNNTINVNFSVDAEAPRVFNQSPTNTTYTIANIYANLTSTDDTGNATAELDGTTNYSMTNTTGKWWVLMTGLVNGAHQLVFFVNDSYGNMNRSVGVNFTVDIPVDETPPTVTVQSPTNTTYTTTAVWANITTNEDTGAGVVQLDDTTNYTLTNSSGNWNRELTGLAQGAHNVRFFINDSSGNMNSSQVVYFTVDTVAPGVTILRPINDTYYTGSIWINVTMTEAGGSVTAQLDLLTNYTLTNSSGNWNKLVTGIANGGHHFQIFGQDAAGNVNSMEKIYFNVAAAPGGDGDTGSTKSAGGGAVTSRSAFALGVAFFIMSFSLICVGRRGKR